MNGEAQKLLDIAKSVEAHRVEPGSAEIGQLLVHVETLEFTIVKIIEHLDARTPGIAQAILAELELEGHQMEKKERLPTGELAASMCFKVQRDLSNRIRLAVGLR
ncbi:hypothetical protein [Gymnodinialimonas ceratoperidinii]|uniref:Uncharacterized protein n=1 Tax=Gymnodinialimonas ceratoperidinii TaxID=2856823 RepID=A0A8F6TYT8_9RHOB|nr:hypothetical protein [Gymnodinialimonas ceratoperidinii]QXT41165.1 hypothetical protein KYE46_08140 [Gymnodinialimonas ceratoperidinii]